MTIKAKKPPNITKATISLTLTKARSEFSFNWRTIHLLGGKFTLYPFSGFVKPYLTKES